MDDDGLPAPPRPLHGPPPRRDTLRLDDGTDVSILMHEPNGEPRPPVVHLHGIQSHPLWFVGSAAALAEAGHRVVQVTRRGSGDCTADRGDARSARQLLDDVAAACRYAAGDHPEAGVHLVGVSWGGKLAAAFAAEAAGSRRPDAETRRRGDGKMQRPGAANPSPSGGGARAAGGGGEAQECAEVPLLSLTLIAPGIVPLVDLSPLGKLAIAASLLFCPRREFDIPLNDPALFTDDEAMRRYIAADPLRLRRATARFFFASRQLDIMLRRAPAGCLTMPVTLILSDRDRIIDSDATRQAFQRLAGDRLQVRELRGAHTLEFKPDPQPLYAALTHAVSRTE